MLAGRVLPLAVSLLLISLGIQTTHSARILLMPFNHKSYVMYYTKLGSALVEDGHDVWILTMTKFEMVVKNSGVRPLLFTVSEKADFAIYLERFMSKHPGQPLTYDRISEVMPIHGRYCDEVMTNEEIIEGIKAQQFDLAIVDGLFSHICMFMLPYRLDLRFITLQTFEFAAWVAGVTGMPSIEPEPQTHLSNKMNFWQRLYNVKSWIATYNNPGSELFSESHMKKYAGNKPKITLLEVMKKSEMFLLNFEIMCLDYPRVSAPNYQFLGVTTASPPEPLPADLEKFVNGAELGIVVMSLGTHKALQWYWLVIGHKVFKALGQLKLRAIVQYDLDEKPRNVPDNVLLLKWLPQNDLLGHPKTRLFITHGGNNGQNEAVYHGVPSLVIPLSVDQPYSGERVERHGYGKYVKDKNAITGDELYEMMTEVIYNETYSQNIKKCSAIVHSMPPASERFVFWVNHILQFGGAHLRPPSLDMPLYQVLMLDIVAFFVMLGLVLVHASLAIIWCFCCRFVKVKKEKTD